MKNNETKRRETVGATTVVVTAGKNKGRGTEGDRRGGEKFNRRKVGERQRERAK